MTTTDPPADPARPAGGGGACRIVIGFVIPVALLKHRKPSRVHPDHREPSGMP
ncbi:hypothetical protein [Streptomyces narbonensis]|uniref:hypothetical protein n=1 Tax=Streptomyces narbonensis TaxID=67333 RepID=UPI001676D7B9|nr:hypothetical protein [Streptomyces narbonensis]